MKYRCSICPYATIENAALKKHIRFKHTHDVRNPFIFKSKAPLTKMNLYCLISETIFMQYLWIQYTYSKYYEKTQARYIHTERYVRLEIPFNYFQVMIRVNHTFVRHVEQLMPTRKDSMSISRHMTMEQHQNPDLTTVIFVDFLLRGKIIYR